VLFLLSLPLFVLAYIPPPPREKASFAFYLLVMSLVLYVVGISVVSPAQGERMRLPILAFIAGVAANNWYAWRAVMDRRSTASLA
jgi:uncharacterized membrane protein